MILPRRNILLFHQAALGDFVLSWPIAMAASRLWPTHRVIYVTPSDKGQLAERAIGVEWRDGDAWHALFGSGADLPPAATKSLAGANLVISFLSTGDDAWASNLRRLAPEAEAIFVRPRPDGPIDRHLTLFHAEQFGAAPELQAAIGQMVRHVSAAGALPRRAAGEQVVLHPGSGADSKRWPHFVPLAAALREAGHSVTVLLGEVERERFSGAEVDALKQVARVATPTTLIELLAALQTARLYIGNDSGPTHLAAMAAVPTIALFGQDNDTVWRPIGPGVRLIKQASLSGLPIETVLSAAAETLAVPQVPMQPAVEEE